MKIKSREGDMARHGKALRGAHESVKRQSSRQHRRLCGGTATRCAVTVSAAAKRRCEAYFAATSASILKRACVTRVAHSLRATNGSRCTQTGRAGGNRTLKRTRLHYKDRSRTAGGRKKGICSFSFRRLLLSRRASRSLILERLHGHELF